ncbi:hypothetical protein ACP70R_028661 [Stipagrostis hirtigluma subsp. patula]
MRCVAKIWDAVTLYNFGDVLLISKRAFSPILQEKGECYMAELFLSHSTMLVAYTKGFAEAAYHYPDILDNIRKNARRHDKSDRMEETLMASNG